MTRPGRPATLVWRLSGGSWSDAQDRLDAAINARLAARPDGQVLDRLDPLGDAMTWARITLPRCWARRRRGRP